jgi:hypothetical protein
MTRIVLTVFILCTISTCQELFFGQTVLTFLLEFYESTKLMKSFFKSSYIDV